MVYATTAILVLSGINILGVREGKWTQNLLTAVKVLGLVGDCRGRAVLRRAGGFASRPGPGHDD